MSTAKFNEWQNPDGTENYKTRAWVNFNGTGTVAIRASGNVASITDNGVGNYTVNFATSMPDANYSATISAGGGSGNIAISGVRDSNLGGIDPTTTAMRFYSTTTGAAALDVSFFNVAIFR